MRREVTEDEFEELFRRTAGELFTYVRRRSTSDPENLVAEVFAIAWRRRGDLPATPLRRAWLFATARRLLLAEARERGLEADAAQLVRRADDAHETTPDSRVLQIVEVALGQLGAKDRELIQLIEWERMTPAEVAVVLGERPGTVRVRLHRARQALAADPGLLQHVDGASQAAPGGPDDAQVGFVHLPQTLQIQPAPEGLV